MKTSPERRNPCGDNLPSFGGCGQSAGMFIVSPESASANSPFIYENITKVPDWTSTPNANGIDPYSRWQNNHPTILSCFPADQFCYQSDGPDNPYCGEPTSSDIIPCDENKVVQGQFFNCFRKTDATASINPCIPVVGHKQILAEKIFHGQFGYTSHEHQPVTATDWCCSCNWVAGSQTPDTTKYLYQSANVTWNQSGLADVSAYATNTAAVNKFNGDVIRTCTSGSSLEPDDSGSLAAATFLLINNIGTSADIYEQYCGLKFLFQSTIGEPDVTSGGPGSTTVSAQWHEDEICVDDPEADPLTFTTYSRLSRELIMTLGQSLTYKRYGKNTDPAVPCGWMLIEEYQWQYSATAFHMTYDKTEHSFSPVLYETHYTIDATLAQPYTAQEAQNEAIDLLKYFPLNDDKIYPWTTGGSRKFPLLTYDEGAQIAVPSLGVCQDDISGRTGQILGKPLPAGYSRYWNPIHPNWKECIDATFGTPVYYIESYGAWSDTDSTTPSATQWLNYRDSIDMFSQAFVGTGFRFTRPVSSAPGQRLDGIMFASKYAEIQIRRPSFNYARPCGIDRYTPDFYSSSCVYSVGGGIATLSYPTNLETGNKVLLCGTGDNEKNGVYQITVNTPTEIALSTLLVSGSQIHLPVDLDCGTGLISKLRFPGSPAICGRSYVTAGSTTSPVTLSLDRDTYLSDGQNILTTLKGGTIQSHTVTVIDLTNVVLNGVSASVDIKYDYIYSPFASDWRWDDDSTKGQFTVIEFGYNYRDISEQIRLANYSASLWDRGTCPDPNVSCSLYTPAVGPAPRLNQYYNGLQQEITSINCVQGCLTPNNPCGKSIIAITPHPTVDYFPNGATYSFGNPTPDQTKGSLWRKLILQSVPDPYSRQKPPCLCAHDEDTDSYACFAPWLEDRDGTCPANLGEFGGDNYYPHRPLVEATCVPVAGAPALLPGHGYIGCLTQPEINIPTIPAGNICRPPEPDDSVIDVGALWENQSSCVAGGGHFAAAYIANGIRPPVEMEI